MSYSSTDGSFDLRKHETSTTFNISFDESGSENLFPIQLENFAVVEKDICPPYEGSYSVRPDFQSQLLDTKGKKMLNDLEVTEIRVLEVTNPFGGVTVFIGG